MAWLEDGVVLQKNDVKEKDVLDIVSTYKHKPGLNGITKRRVSLSANTERGWGTEDDCGLVGFLGKCGQVTLLIIFDSGAYSYVIRRGDFILFPAEQKYQIMNTRLARVVKYTV